MGLYHDNPRDRMHKPRTLLRNSQSAGGDPADPAHYCSSFGMQGGRGTTGTLAGQDRKTPDGGMPLVEPR